MAQWGSRLHGDATIAGDFLKSLQGHIALGVLSDMFDEDTIVSVQSMIVSFSLWV